MSPQGPVFYPGLFAMIRLKDLRLSFKISRRLTRPRGQVTRSPVGVSGNLDETAALVEVEQDAGMVADVRAA